MKSYFKEWAVPAKSQIISVKIDNIKEHPTVKLGQKSSE